MIMVFRHHVHLYCHRKNVRLLQRNVNHPMIYLLQNFWSFHRNFCSFHWTYYFRSIHYYDSFVNWRH